MAMQKIRGASRKNTQKVIEIFNAHMAKLPIADVETINGRVTYDPSNGEISFKLTIKVPNEDGKLSDSKDVRAFEAFKHRHPEIENHNVGDVFKSARTCYKIIGYRPRAHKRPVMAENLNTGKTFVFPAKALAHVEWQS
jgi:hypothetical protein